MVKPEIAIVIGLLQEKAVVNLLQLEPEIEKEIEIEIERERER